MPLTLQVRIIELDGSPGRSHHRGFGQRHDLAAGHMPELLVELHLADLGDCGHLPGHEIQVGIGVETDEIPAVQPCGPRTLLMARIDRKKAPERLHPDTVKHGIEIADARTGSDAARTRHSADRRFDPLRSIAAEADQQLALPGIVGRENEFGGEPVIGRGLPCLPEFVLGARPGEDRGGEQQAPESSHFCHSPIIIKLCAVTTRRYLKGTNPAQQFAYCVGLCGEHGDNYFAKRALLSTSLNVATRPKVFGDGSQRSGFTLSVRTGQAQPSPAGTAFDFSRLRRPASRMSDTLRYGTFTTL